MLSDITFFEPVSTVHSSAQLCNSPDVHFLSGQASIQSLLLTCVKNRSPQPLVVAGGSGNLALCSMLSRVDAVYCLNGRTLNAMTQDSLELAAKSLPHQATMVVVDCADQADQAALVGLVGHIMLEGVSVTLLTSLKHSLAPIITIQAKTVILSLEESCLS